MRQKRSIKKSDKKLAKKSNKKSYKKLDKRNRTKIGEKQLGQKITQEQAEENKTNL